MDRSLGWVLLSERIDAVIRFFLYVLVFWLPYSPAVVESCVVISFVLWVVKRAVVAGQQKSLSGLPHQEFYQYLKDFKPAPSPIDKPIVFFLAFCLISAISSVFWRQSLPNFLTKTVEWFIVYFLVVEVFRKKTHIYIVLILFIVTSLATALDSIVQVYVTHKDLFLGHSITLGGRPTAAFKTSNGLGGYLTVAIPAIFAAALFKNRNLRYRVLIPVIFLFTLWSLVLTFSRGAWLGTFLGGMLMLFIFFFHRQKAELYLSLGFFLIIVFLYLLFGLILAGSSSSDLLGRFSTILWRVDIWRDSIPMIKDNLLFGHGINTYMQLFESYRTGKGGPDPTYAHNCYIQLAVETGIAGLFAFLWIIVELFRKSMICLDRYWAANYNLTILAVGLFSGIFAFLVHSFFDTHLYSLQLSVYLWFMIGLHVVILEQLKCQSAGH